MKRLLTYFLVPVLVCVAVLLCKPTWAAQVMNYTRAVAFTPASDMIKIYKKTTDGVFEDQVISLPTLASNITSISTSGGAAQLSMGIHSFSLTTTENGTVTNVFNPYFTSAPIVVIAQTGNATTVTNTYTVTRSNVIYSAGAPSIVVKGIAIGAP